MSRIPARLVVAVTCLLFMGISAVSAFDFSELQEKITEKTLDNGLKVIVMERHDAPVASFVTWADVGSVDDPKGATGMAHMFEHMSFKGTESIGSEDIDKELKLMAVEDSLITELQAERVKGSLADTARVSALQAAFEEAREAAYQVVVPEAYTDLISREGGVAINAGTASDFTVYFFSLPSNKVELWAAMESDRFLNPVLREMYRERDVIAEERRMRTETSPFGRLLEEFLGLSYKAHPYGIEGVGHMSDIQNFTRGTAEAYFEKYYGPSNLTVVIVGDVKAKDIFKMAEKYWGRIPYRPAPDPIATVEPEQPGERRVVIEDPSQPLFIAGWHIPEITHPDRPALDAMMDYLAQGRTSLLYKNLVKEKKIALVATSLVPAYVGDKYPTMAIVYAVPSQDHDNYECEEQILAEIERMKEELLSPEDIDKIKARAKAEFIAGGGFGGGLNSNLGLAIQLGYFQNLYGDWREMFKTLDRINAVTAEDVQRVAKLYFTKKNRVVAMMNTVKS
ncbi:MAG TPA: pitrilysin family protein [Acidobacteriota bacterium]|nr:pitrilysin family protein [Acidobacteriota bacterium]